MVQCGLQGSGFMPPGDSIKSSVKFATSRLFLLLSALFLTAPDARAVIDVTLQMQLGNPSGATADTNNHDHFLIQRAVEALDYSDHLGEPVWASWDLTAGDVGSNARSAVFFTDTNLPANFYRVTDSDYNGVGAINFARGHLCPSEDRTDTRADNDQVFFMSNIMPQDAVNNSGVWAQFENYCRSLAVSNELLITCGPSGFGTNRIPSGKAAISAYTWKIAVVVPTNSGTALSRVTSATRVIALKIPNADAATNSWSSYVTSAAQIEVDTGFTFFTALPANVAAVLRNKVDGQVNPPPVIFAFSPASGAAGTNVIITGTNFNAASAVAFNGSSATFTVNANTQITASVPATASSGFISVTTPGGTAVSASSFTINGGGSVPGGVLAGWNVNGQSGFGPTSLAATTSATNLLVTGLARGSGVKTAGNGAANGWGGTGFTTTSATSAVASNQFVTFGIMAANGYAVSFSAVSQFEYRRSSAGPTTGVLQFQLGDGAFTDIASLNYSSSSAAGATNSPIDLSGIAALQNVGANTNVTFRIVNYGASNSGGTWYVYDVGGDNNLDLEIQGAVTRVASATNPPAAVPAFLPPVWANNQFQFTLTGTSGSNYVVQTTTNLLAPNWIPVTTNAAPFVFIQSNANLFQQQFYRAVVAP
jgi:DNA/RNA endonuclease G (NUC1)